MHKIINAPTAEELRPSEQLRQRLEAIRQQVKDSRSRDWNLGDGPDRAAAIAKEGAKQ